MCATPAARLDQGSVPLWLFTTVRNLVEFCTSLANMHVVLVPGVAFPQSLTTRTT